MASVASSHFRYVATRYTYTYMYTYYAWNSCLSLPVDGYCLLLLPRCMVFTGYHVNSNNSNSQQQPTAGYKQANHYQMPVHQDCRQKKHYVTCHMKFAAIHHNFTNLTLYAVQLNVDLTLVHTILVCFSLILLMSCSHVICHTQTKMTRKCSRITLANLVNASLIMSMNKSIETVLNINLTCKFCAKHTQFF